MRLFIIMLLLVGAAMAFTVKPDYIGILDTGSESLPTLDIDIMIDCDTTDATVEVSSEGQPIEGADAVLFYTDYAYQPLPGGGKTDSDGQLTMAVPGDIDFLTDLYILRVDASGYRSRQIEFSYIKCSEPPPEPGEEPEEPGEEPEVPVLLPLSIDVRPTCDGSTVTGNVVTVTSDGDPVADAYVDVEDIEPLKKIKSGYTDAQGQFKFQGCGDEYSIRASRGGYESEKANITLTNCDECVEPEEPEEEPEEEVTQPEEPVAPEEPPEEPAEEEPGEAPAACPLGALFFSLLMVKVIKC